MNYSNECSLVRDRAVVAAREEIRLFCRILGYSNNDLNHLIGDDPHGIVDMQEGYRHFNMTDIHVLIADYARWLAIYKDNQTLRKVVDEWYYWTLENHEPRKDEWVSVKDKLPQLNKICFGMRDGKIPRLCMLVKKKNGECVFNTPNEEYEYSKGKITNWMPIPPLDKPKYCNLKNWLMGWRPEQEGKSLYRKL